MGMDGGGENLRNKGINKGARDIGSGLFRQVSPV